MKQISILLISSAVILTSCVSKKKFHNEQTRVSNLKKDSISNHSNLQICNAKVIDLENWKTEMQKDISDLSSSYDTSMKNSKMTIAEQAKRLKDIQTLIQSQKDILNKLKKTVADALINFKPDELSV